MAAQIRVEELLPIEKNDLTLMKHSKIDSDIGHITYSALQCCRGQVSCFENNPKDGKASFSLSLEAPDSSLMSVPLSFLSCSLVPVGRDDQLIHTTVTTTSTDPGVYMIQCNPKTSGAYTIKIQVYGVQVEATSLVIPFNPYYHSITPVRMIEVNHPCGVVGSDDGCVIVSENGGNCVTILDREGKKVKSFGGESRNGDVKFSRPRGIAITEDKFLLVSDSHKIQKVSMDGMSIATVGKKGTRSLQFNCPDSVAISPVSRLVYVVDNENDRIQVFNPDLTFSHAFGSKRSSNGQFQSPHGIAFDFQGFIYITDRDNNRVQKFSQDGKFVAHFGSKKSGPGQLDSPVGIAIDTAATGLVYVSERGNHRISIFTSDGVFVRSFGRKGSSIDQFINPYGMAFGKDGFLYICDFSNDRLVVY